MSERVQRQRRQWVLFGNPQFHAPGALFVPETVPDGDTIRGPPPADD